MTKDSEFSGRQGSWGARVMVFTLWSHATSPEGHILTHHKPNMAPRALAGQHWFKTHYTVKEDCAQACQRKPRKLIHTHGTHKNILCSLLGQYWVFTENCLDRLTGALLAVIHEFIMYLWPRCFKVGPHIGTPLETVALGDATKLEITLVWKCTK